MIKKLLMAAAVVVMAVPAAAQGSRRSEVSVSYGVAPVTDWIDSYSDMLTGLFTNANTDLEGWGAVTVGYSFRLIGINFKLLGEFVPGISENVPVSIEDSFFAADPLM